MTAKRKYDRKELEKLRKQGLTWKEIAERVNGSPLYLRSIMTGVLCEKICAVCGNEFTCVQGTTMYCSEACNQKAFRLRQKMNSGENHNTNANRHRRERENANRE